MHTETYIDSSNSFTKHRNSMCRPWNSITMMPNRTVSSHKRTPSDNVSLTKN